MGIGVVMSTTSYRINPRIVTDVGPDVFPLLGTIRRLVPVLAASGAPSGATNDVTIYQNVPIRLMPLIQMRPTNRETTTDVVRVLNTWHVALKGYYPNIKEEDTLTVGPTVYNILGIEPDSNHILTRLRVEEVKLGV